MQRSIFFNFGMQFVFQHALLDAMAAAIFHLLAFLLLLLAVELLLLSFLLQHRHALGQLLVAEIETVDFLLETPILLLTFLQYVVQIVCL